MVPGHDASRAVLQEELRGLGRAEGITGLRCLSGGAIADTWLISYADGTSVVGKTLAGAAPGLFRAEADGLAALRGTGHLTTPAVLAVWQHLPLPRDWLSLLSGPWPRTGAVNRPRRPYDQLRSRSSTASTEA